MDPHAVIVGGGSGVSGRPGSSPATHAIVWAGGLPASPLGRSLGAKVDRTGRAQDGPHRRTARARRGDRGRGRQPGGTSDARSGSWRRRASSHLEDALEIRRRVPLSCEAAERCANTTERQARPRFVVNVSGPTGVELAGALAESPRTTLAVDFRVIDPTRAVAQSAAAAPPAGRRGAHRRARDQHEPGRGLGGQRAAPVAIQQGRAAADNGGFQGRPTAPFHYRDRGNVAAIGRAPAVVVVRGLHLSGFVAWLLVHISS